MKPSCPKERGFAGKSHNALCFLVKNIIRGIKKLFVQKLFSMSNILTWKKNFT
jgi:hypothetical protein